MTNDAANLSNLLTLDAIDTMNEDELNDLYLLMIRDQLHTVHELTGLTDYKGAFPNDYHALHSDDGWDYLTAALDLASELASASPVMTGPDFFRDWLRNKLNPDHEATIFNYACDGVSPMLWSYLYDDDELDKIIQQPGNDAPTNTES